MFDIRRFRDLEKPIAPQRPRPLLVLRHDLDFSIDHAVELAQIEFTLGVRSTYFVRLDALHYNAMTMRSIRMLKKIIGWGHDIGIHYSPGLAIASGCSALETVKFQFETLRSLLGYDVVGGAMHEPSRNSFEPGRFNELLNWRFEAYETRFTSEMKYLSDSAGRWREGCVCDWLKREIDLCVVTHPLWWFQESTLERY